MQDFPGFPDKVLQVPEKNMGQKAGYILWCSRGKIRQMWRNLLQCFWCNEEIRKIPKNSGIFPTELQQKLKII